MIDKNLSSIITLSEISRLWKEYGIPNQFKIQAPDPDEKADCPHEGWIDMYKVFLKLG